MTLADLFAYRVTWSYRPLYDSNSALWTSSARPALVQVCRLVARLVPQFGLYKVQYSTISKSLKSHELTVITLPRIQLGANSVIDSGEVETQRPSSGTRPWKVPLERSKMIAISLTNS